MVSKNFSSVSVTVCLSTILSCLALSSILELGLKLSAPKRPGDWNELTKDLVSRATVAVIWWPQKMFPNEEGILTASAALALLSTFILSVLGIYASRQGSAGTTKVRLSVLFVLALNLLLATAAFLFSFIQSKLSSRVDVGYVEDLYKDAMSGGNFLYEKGKFTSEIWACGMDSIIMEEYNGEMKTACAMHMGARWLTFTTFIFSAALFGVIFLDSRREGHILHSSKSLYGP